ncbi:MAG: glycosyltransferase family 2 protein [Desulfobulbaceae bacterium]|nr:MAG: glycosyltransferase family 2 protein [Desulfobulbaceae bacterium]
MHKALDSQISFSVIIPTLNGAHQLRELLAALTIQTIQPREILILDSESDDKTREVASEYETKIITIKRETFDHGSTRSFGAGIAETDILVYFTQDALPANRMVLENLVDPLVEDQEIAMSYGRQLPAFDADEISRHLRLFNYGSLSYTRSYEDRIHYGFSTIFVSNSCAAYRKSTLLEIGSFQENLIFGEDSSAAAAFLKKGYKVAYRAESEVYHSHNYTISEEFTRYFDIGVFHASQKKLLEDFGSSEKRGMQYLKSGLSYLRKRGRYGLMAEFVVRIACKLTGYRLGKQYQQLPRSVASRCSMNRKWWMKPANN